VEGVAAFGAAPRTESPAVAAETASAAGEVVMAKLLAGPADASGCSCDRSAGRSQRGNMARLTPPGPAGSDPAGRPRGIVPNEWRAGRSEGYAGRKVWGFARADHGCSRAEIMTGWGRCEAADGGK